MLFETIYSSKSSRCRTAAVRTVTKEYSFFISIDSDCLIRISKCKCYLLDAFFSMIDIVIFVDKWSITDGTDRHFEIDDGSTEGGKRECGNWQLSDIYLINQARPNGASYIIILSYMRLTANITVAYCFPSLTISIWISHFIFILFDLLYLSYFLIV